MELKNSGEKFGFLITVFSSLTMFSIFFLHEIDVNSSISLFEEFSVLYPKETKVFSWAFSCTSNFPNEWLIIAISAALISGVIHLVTMHLFSKTAQNKKKYVNILIILNLGLFFGFSVIFKPVIINRMVTLSFATASILITSVSTHWFIIHDGLKLKRRELTPNKKNSNYILKNLDFEYSEYKQGLQIIISVFAFLTAGLIFATLSQYVFNLPLEITFSIKFGEFLTAIAIVFILNSVGLFIGLLYQLTREMNDVKDVIREFSQLP